MELVRKNQQEVDNSQANNYISNISYLRIFATVCIVWLHTCSTLTDNNDLFSLTDTQYFFLGTGYHIMCWTVPIFFMMTGALLLNKKITYQQCFDKYVRRIINALFLFGIPFAALKIIMQSKSISINTVLYSLRAILENDSFSHLWYLYVLIGIYLVLPILQLVVSEIKDEQFVHLLKVLMIGDFIFPLINSLTGLRIAFTIPFTYPLFYVLAGYYINTRQTNGKKRSKVICIALIIIAVVVINYLKLYPKKWASYSSPLTAILAICIFSLFKQIRFRSYNVKVWKIDRLCFGVYLIHPLFIHFIYRFLKISPVSFNLYYIAVIPFFIIFILCGFICSWILNKINLLNKYVL